MLVLDLFTPMQRLIYSLGRQLFDKKGVVANKNLKAPNPAEVMGLIGCLPEHIRLGNRNSTFQS